MLYFSELKGKRVLTEDGIFVGKLDDLIFLLSEKPLLTKLVIKNVNKQEIIIPFIDLKKINEEIKIKKNYIIGKLEANELYLLKNLLDKQIIDLKGNKIVRVNDIAIQDKNEFYVAGVDIGFLGILRWFKIEKIISQILGVFKLKISSNFLSWAEIQPLELARGKVQLKNKEEKLKKVPPEDLADYLETTNVVNAQRILKILDEKQAAEVINSLNLNFQLVLLRHYPPVKAATLINLLEVDEACDILLNLSKKRREMILTLLSEKKRKEIERLMELANTPIGHLLTTDFLTVFPNNLVSEVIDKIKKETADFSYLYTIYVVNQENQLIGVFDLHELLLQSLETPVYRFMTQNLIVVHLNTPLEIVYKKMIKYKLNLLPVIDFKKNILGVVSFDDISETFIKK